MLEQLEYSDSTFLVDGETELNRLLFQSSFVENSIKELVQSKVLFTKELSDSQGNRLLSHLHTVTGGIFPETTMEEKNAGAKIKTRVKKAIAALKRILDKIIAGVRKVFDGLFNRNKLIQANLEKLVELSSSLPSKSLKNSGFMPASRVGAILPPDSGIQAMTLKEILDFTKAIRGYRGLRGRKALDLLADVTDEDQALVPVYRKVYANTARALGKTWKKGDMSYMGFVPNAAVSITIDNELNAKLHKRLTNGEVGCTDVYTGKLVGSMAKNLLEGLNVIVDKKLFAEFEKDAERGLRALEEDSPEETVRNATVFIRQAINMLKVEHQYVSLAVADGYNTLLWISKKLK